MKLYNYQQTSLEHGLKKAEIYANNVIGNQTKYYEPSPEWRTAKGTFLDGWVKCYDYQHNKRRRYLNLLIKLCYRYRNKKVNHILSKLEELI